MIPGHSSLPRRFSRGVRYSLRFMAGFFGLLLLMVCPGRLAAQNPFVGQIEMFAGNFAPTGWAFCEGQLLSIAENDVLFSLIGTTYGGDGVSTFALPDLRGRTPVDVGQGPALANYAIGQMGGQESVTLTPAQMPSHNHAAMADSLPGVSDSPAGALPALSPDGVPGYAPDTQPIGSARSTASTGGGQPHNNMKPYLAIRYIIALYGIYPSRN